MLGSDNSFFDSPSFLQKIMKKKSSSKYNIRPLYTAEIINEVNTDNPWKKQLNAATKVANSYSISQQQQQLQQQQGAKTYNHPSIHHQYIPTRPPPSISPSYSSTTFNTDSTVVYPTPSCSTPTSQYKPHRKRPLSSEILIKIMDQRLMKMQQQQQAEEMSKCVSNHGPLLHRSASSSTATNVHAPALKSSKSAKTITATSIAKTTRRRRDSGNTNIGNTTTMRRHNAQIPSTKKLKTSKSVLHKLNHHHPIINHNTSQQQLITEWPYVLTQDNDEQDRMVAQHYLLRTAFGGDFSAPIQHLLQKGIVVLDVGCGNGTWTMEMSTAFPKSTFIGIDQSAFYPKDIKPRNCHFRSCGSLVKPLLPFPDNSIDFIYQRDMNWGLHAHTWQPLLNEYQRVLKPGGWIEFVEPVSISDNPFFFYQTNINLLQQELETHDSLDNECAMNDKRKFHLLQNITIMHFSDHLQFL